MGISPDAHSKPVSLTITGMHCGNCVARVAKALTSIGGVEVDSLSIGTAVVRIDERNASIDDLVAAVARAGYSAVPSVT